jgi:prepilin-type N-terminal cleavage/methylation domain-containing protein
VPSQTGEHDGFTLIEVLVAAFVASLVFGFLVSWMAQNLRSVGAARAQQHALLLGEQRARDYDLELRQSGLVEDGVEHGEFADPDSDLGWEVRVEPWHLPLPADYDRDASPSPLFESARRQREVPEPALHRVTVRVFALDDPDTDLITPFQLFGVVPGQSPQAAGGVTGPGAIDPATGLPIQPGPSSQGSDPGKSQIRPGSSGPPSPTNPRMQRRDDRARDSMGRR